MILLDRRMLTALLICFVSACAAKTQKCARSYGDVVEVEGCSSVKLPDFSVSFVGDSQPMENLPMQCWNYEVSNDAEKATFQQCHTGALGGATNFILAGKSFTVVFDVAAGCKQLPSGSWVPETSGHAFYAGVLSTKDLVNMGQEQDQGLADCYARTKASAN